MEKYFIQNNYTGYLVQIFEVGFTGISTEIFGKVSFDKGNVDNILDTIRGTGLNLQLEANPLLTFEEFSEADERTYTVKVTNSTGTVFQGFLKPDGVTQSFVRDIWIVDLDFIDGLGSLKDLAFVKLDGTNYTGKMSIFEVVTACLARTGLVMTINTFVDVLYLDYAGTNILKDTYVNSNRFFKIDSETTGGGTTMTCEEVLNSVLNLFSACITQQDGYWWVYRPNEFLTHNSTFIDNTLNTTFTKNLYKKIGSQIDNFYPHHCGGNQQIQTKGAISAYRLNYKYGYVKSLINNNRFKHLGLIYEDWTINTANTSYIVIDYTDEFSLKMNPNNSGSLQLIATSIAISLNKDDVFNFKTLIKADGIAIFGFYVKAGIYYMKYTGEWTTTPTHIIYSAIEFASNIDSVTLNIKSFPLPINANVTIDIFVPETGLTPEWATQTEIYSLDIVPANDARAEIGEFHTVTRLVAPSSIIKENQEVYNGDSIGIVYDGAIYKSDKTTLTTLWTRKGRLEEKSILQISAEDDMRIQQKPIKAFTGDIYGYVPYLSIIEINNVNGLFMFIEHSYDTDSNITRGKLQQFYTSEVADLQYLLTYDYGNTVKPSIRS